MQELMRESRGDFKYLRIEPSMFQEMVNIVTVIVSPYSLCTEAARAPYDPIESLRRLCGDCTEIARLSYRFVSISPPRIRKKHRTIIVYYVNTCAVARSHIRCPKKPYGKSQTKLSHGARGKCKLGLSARTGGRCEAALPDNYRKISQKRSLSAFCIRRYV